MPTLKIKPGRTAPKPKFPAGLGYDSESSEREDDPSIEEQFILRMPPGEDAELLREAIETRTLDAEGPIWIRWGEGRRAVVCVRGRYWAATLYDLPTVTESFKCLDKKNVHKVADISQILVVEERIPDESAITPTKPGEPHEFPDGLTAPLKSVRTHRFRKREYTNRAIEATEREVSRLEALDAEAESSVVEMIDEADIGMYDQQMGGEDDDGYDMLHGYGQEDAEGEEDAEGDDFDELANELENALEEDDDDEDEDGAAPHTGTTTQPGQESAEDSDMADGGDESGSDEGEELDEHAQEMQKLRDEIADLEESMREKEKEMEGVMNPIIRMRKEGFIKNLREEITMKKKMLGEGNDDD